MLCCSLLTCAALYNAVQLCTTGHEPQLLYALGSRTLIVSFVSLYSMQMSARSFDLQSALKIQLTEALRRVKHLM